ncbi:MAG: hypothetical protein ABW148_01480 [Sedimenticola sp.]
MERVVDVAIENALREIGSRLDQRIFPRVKNGGLVMPSELTVPSTLGEEKYHEKQRRSTTKPRKWAPGGERAAGRSWSPRQATPLVSTSVQVRYEDELDAIHRAYPGTKVWEQADGLWLLTESSLLPRLQKAAIFLTGVSYDRTIVRAWGFWRCSLGGLTWIGSRHTNFPDGSICAFHPTDGTWVFGDSIVELLDLYTLWAFRHLHLEVFGRWPGQQAVFHPYERILELKEDEYCGCGRPDMLYGECCRDKDLSRNQVADAVNFVIEFAGGLREPPHAIVQSVREQSEPPSLNDLLLK